MAEESRYVARSALIAAQPGKCRGRKLLSQSQFQRVRQFVRVGIGSPNITGSTQSSQRSPGGERHEHGHWPAPIGDLDSLTGLDEPQQLTGALT